MKVIYGRIRSFYLVEFVPYYYLLVVFDFVPFVFFCKCFGHLVMFILPISRVFMEMFLSFVFLSLVLKN